MRHLVILLSLVALAIAPAMAGTLTLTGPGACALQIVGTAPLLSTPNGAAVSGTITLSPGESLQAGLTSTFYVDSQARFASALPRPELAVDTTKLTDGVHELRMDVSDGTQLAFSTGGIPIHVVNNSTVNLITGQAGGGNAPFVKLYRKILLREIVWFNNREADLEKHAVIRGGRVFITLTDLLRHVGGTIIWGPSKSYVVAERNSVKLRFVPGTRRAYVNGKAVNFDRATWRADSRLFVPIRPVLALLGLDTDWNRIPGRAYVNTP